METPPRAWGRPDEALRQGLADRNTPTGVGTTADGAHAQGWQWKHPHGRGDDMLRDGNVGLQEETPPRAWGRRAHAQASLALPRNTPTGVGTTAQWRLPTRLSQKHPHGRGDDVASGAASKKSRETPPRAWGRLQRGLCCGQICRNTPTGVGTTANAFVAWQANEKHPHGRGDDLEQAVNEQESLETPPRAWGRPAGVARFDHNPRNTPTGVGTTALAGVFGAIRRNTPTGVGTTRRPPVQ